MNRFSRRTFLIAGLVGGAAAMVADPTQMAHAAESSAAAATPSSFVPRLLRHRPELIVVGRGKEYASLTRRIMDALGPNAPLARPGEQVVIKPTLAYNRLPGQGGNVHPDVLRATIELALDGGASQVLVFDRTALLAPIAYRVSGAQRAIQQIRDSRVRLVVLEEADFVPLDFSTLDQIAIDPNLPEQDVQAALERLAQVRICRHLLEADRLINLASARVHPTHRVALTMANLMGLIGGGPADAAWLRHREHELAVLTAALRPDLTILDATRAVIRNGPMGQGLPDLAHLHTLVASRDPLAVEAYGANLLGVPPNELPAIELAAQLGAGSPRLTRSRLFEL